MNAEERPQPEPRRPLRGPTIIRPPDRPPRPAGGQGETQAEVAAREPTRLGPPGRRETPPTRRVASPTAVAGRARERIEVGLAELRALSPGSSEDVLGAALRELQMFVVADATPGRAVLWGHELQREYGELVSKTLAHAQAPVLARVHVHLSRMIDILRSIDLGAVAGVTGEGARVGTLFKRFSNKIDTREELRRATTEIDQLVQRLSDATTELVELKDAIYESLQRVAALGDRVEAAAVAAQFLSEYLRPKSEEVSRRFFERAMSLTQTALQIRGSASLGASQLEQPLALIRAIQDVALVAVPAWLGTVTSLITLTDRSPTPTEAGEAGAQLQEILKQLPS